MSQLILGLGNKARHGKDTFAKAIETYYANQHAAAVRHSLSHYKPVVVQQHAFADALYREVNSWLGSAAGVLWANMVHRPTGHYTPTSIPSWVIPDANPEKNTRAPHGKHPKLLQWWGTELRRSKDPLYWVKQWMAGINPKADIVLCTDMRFLNEAAAVKEVGGYTFRVSRLNTDGTPFVDPSRPADHVSETELDGYNVDYQVTIKTGDVALLEELAVTYVHYLRALKGHK